MSTIVQEEISALRRISGNNSTPLTENFIGIFRMSGVGRGYVQVYLDCYSLRRELFGLSEFDHRPGYAWDVDRWEVERLVIFTGRISCPAEYRYWVKAADKVKRHYLGDLWCRTTFAVEGYTSLIHPSLSGYANIFAGI